MKILVRVAEFPARHLNQLQKRAGDVDWTQWLPRGAAVQLRATCRKSRIYHTAAACQRVATALEQQLGHIKQDTGTAVHLRIANDQCTLSLDSSGGPLYRRGYRLATAKAPLREDLARAAVILSGWDCESPLLDPFCGSGTIAIEAALVAARTPPGSRRSFAFMQWANYTPELFDQIHHAALAQRIRQVPTIYASDRDAGAIVAATDNAKRAGFAQLRIERVPLSAAPGWTDTLGAVVCNPPHGRRIGKRDQLRSLYQKLGQLIRSRNTPIRFTVACTDRLLLQSLGLSPSRTMTTNHSGQRLHLHCGACSCSSTNAL